VPNGTSVTRSQVHNWSGACEMRLIAVTAAFRGRWWQDDQAHLTMGHAMGRPAAHPGAGAPPPEAIEVTAPEAARVIARTLALTCADCTNGGGGSGGRSAHVPDHHLSGLG
jgi:hypothetical protein